MPDRLFTSESVTERGPDELVVEPAPWFTVGTPATHGLDHLAAGVGHLPYGLGGTTPEFPWARVNRADELPAAVGA